MLIIISSLGVAHHLPLVNLVKLWAAMDMRSADFSALSFIPEGVS
jgi:hypothetical protein